MVNAIKSEFAPCDQSEQVKVCHEGKSYVSSDFPVGSVPCPINVTMQVKDVIEINEEKHTITLFLDIFVTWTDERINVNQDDNDERF